MSSRIDTIPALIGHFGGPLATARVLRTTPQKVCHWRRKGYIPAHHFKLYKRLLREADPLIEASDDLWGWREAAE